MVVLILKLVGANGIGSGAFDWCRKSGRGVIRVIGTNRGGVLYRGGHKRCCRATYRVGVVVNEIDASGCSRPIERGAAIRHQCARCTARTHGNPGACDACC